MNITIENGENLSLLENIITMLNEKRYYKLDHIFSSSDATLDDIQAICNYIDTELQTKEERKFLINGIVRILNGIPHNKRIDYITVLAPHTAIMTNLVENFVFYGSDLDVIWEIGCGRKIIKRSQRKLRNYLAMLQIFGERVDAQDLEFGVFMAGKMKKSNVTHILLNDYSKKLNASQIERLEALNLLFVMNNQDELCY